MSEVLVQFLDRNGKLLNTIPMNEDGLGTSELVINDGHGRVVNLKHLYPHLSLMLIGLSDRIMIGDEVAIEPGNVRRFDLKEFTLRIIHDPQDSISLK